MDLSALVDPKMYREFAGASWPSYADFVAGTRTSDPGINQELDEFIAIAQSRYDDLKIGQGAELAQDNQERQRQVFFDKQVAAPHCRVPWNTMGVNTNGEVFICQSPSWVPKFVGNILEADDLYTILNSSTAKDIRREILLNRYYYCNHKLCGFFKQLDLTLYQGSGSTLPSSEFVDDALLTVDTVPGELIFDFDYTCNFKCPSCRTEVINWNKHHLIRPINNRIAEKIKTLVIDQIQDQPVTIRWAGGEPFISDVYMDIFQYIVNKSKPNIQNVIQTNGSYLHAPIVAELIPYISELRISFDAGTSETYAKIRVNGNWNKLLKNVEYIRQFIDANGYSTKLTADFVVQADNYREIPVFVEICKSLGITNFNLQKLWNWGTWDMDTFKMKNVYDEDHPEYAELMKIINDVRSSS